MKELGDIVEARINGHSKSRTALINRQKFLHRQNLGQILMQKARKGGQEINECSN